MFWGLILLLSYIGWWWRWWWIHVLLTKWAVDGHSLLKSAFGNQSVVSVLCLPGKNTAESLLCWSLHWMLKSYQFLQCRMIYGYSTMQPYGCLNQMMKKQGNYVGAAAMCLGGKSSSEKGGQCHWWMHIRDLLHCHNLLYFCFISKLDFCDLRSFLLLDWAVQRQQGVQEFIQNWEYVWKHQTYTPTRSGEDLWEWWTHHPPSSLLRSEHETYEERDDD